MTMAHRLDFEHDGQGAVITYSSRVSGREVLESVRTMYQKDCRGRLRYSIANFSDVTRLDYAENDVRSIAFLDGAVSAGNPDQIIAVVGARDLLDTVVSQFAIYTKVWSEFDCQLFRTESSARNWIVSVFPDLTGQSDLGGSQRPPC